MARGPPPIHNTDSLLQSCTRAQTAACWVTASGSISAARSKGTHSGRTWLMLASTATVSDNPPPNPDRLRNPYFAQPLVFEAWQLGQEPQQRRRSTITAWPTLRFEDESAGACITRPQNSWSIVTGRTEPVKGCGWPPRGMIWGPYGVLNELKSLTVMQLGWPLSIKYSWRSLPQMPHHSTETRACPDPGSGSGTS